MMTIVNYLDLKKFFSHFICVKTGVSSRFRSVVVSQDTDRISLNFTPPTFKRSLFGTDVENNMVTKDKIAHYYTSINTL